MRSDEPSERLSAKARKGLVTFRRAAWLSSSAILAAALPDDHPLTRARRETCGENLDH